MIKFFRRIRQQLLGEGKTGKYFKYALGEILLVMIGILLALQVNNWNEKRKGKEFEITMLHAIKSSLESDLSMHNFLKGRVIVKQNGIQRLLKMMDDNQVYADSILLKAYNDMNFQMGFNYNKGGYEGIKSVGIDKISNDSLRNILIDTYEVQLPTVAQLISVIDNNIPDNINKLELHNALWKRIRIKLPDSTYKLVSRTVDNKNFLKKPELLDRIKLEQDDMNMLLFWLNNFDRSVKKCLDAVNKELGYD